MDKQNLSCYLFNQEILKDFVFYPAYYSDSEPFQKVV